VTHGSPDEEADSWERAQVDVSKPYSFAGIASAIMPWLKVGMCLSLRPFEPPD
jgi:hypothetical protein